MTKFLLALIGLCVVAFIVIIGSSAFSTNSNNKVSMESQITERTRLEENTKQQAAQLRVEESSRTLNILAVIFGPMLLLGMITLVAIIADSKMTQHRLMEIRELTRLDQLKIREEKQLLAMQQRFQLEQQGYYLSRDNGRVVESDVWAQTNR